MPSQQSLKDIFEADEEDKVPQFNKQLSSLRLSMPADMVHQMSALDFVRRASRGKARRYMPFMPSMRKRLIFFLVFLGIVAGSIDLGIRGAISGVLAARHAMMSDQEGILGYLLWVSSAVVMIVLALWWTKMVQPIAAGSGLPQIKSILSGSDIKDYLCCRTFFSKVGGLIAASSSGLSIGSEGPFVHISCIVADQLLRLGMFNEFRKRKNFRLQVISAAAAVGVAVNFSAPIGGALFSIEVTATYYLLENYWKSFLSSISASIATTLVRSLFIGDIGFEQLFQTYYPLNSFHASELLLFALVGVSMGVLGALFVHCYTFYRKALAAPLFGFFDTFIKRWIFPIIVVIITATVTYYPGSFMHCNLATCVRDLVSEKELPIVWQQYDTIGALAIFGGIYFVLTPLSIVLPVPCGVFIPTFAVGAAFGRAIGMLAHRNVLFTHAIYPGAYAIAGGAGLTAGVTRTISSAMIVLEITGQLHFALPVFVSVLVAYGVGDLLSKGLFEAIMVARGLPYLPIVQYHKDQRVQDVMSTNTLKLSRSTDYLQIIMIINMIERKTVPIVKSDEKPVLLGSISKFRLIQLMKHFYQKHNLQDVNADLGLAQTTMHKDTYISRSAATFKSMVCSENSPKSCNAMYQQWQDNNHNVLNNEKLQSLLSSHWPLEKVQLMNQRVDILDILGGEGVLSPPVLTVPRMAYLEEAHLIFVMMRCQKLYVTFQGTLCGELTAHLRCISIMKSMTRHFNVGIIGAGRIGKVHAKSLLMAGANVVSIADPDGSVVKHVGNEFNIEHCTTNENEVFSHNKIGAVVICSPTNVHAQHILSAAENGKHVFCEKPVDLSVDIVQSLKSKIENLNVQCMIGFNRRFDTNAMRVRKAIADKEIGDLSLLRITSYDPSPPPVSYLKVSGGMFVDMSIHDFDMARYLVGSEVESVYAVGKCRDANIAKVNDIDTAITVLEFKNNVICTIENSRSAAYGYDQRLEALGSNGGVTSFNRHHNQVSVSGPNKIYQDLPMHFFLDRYLDSYTLEMEIFKKACTTDNAVPVNINDGLQALIIANAAQASLNSKSKILL